MLWRKKNNKTIYIECKRIKSDSRLEQNFSKACKQLKQIDKTENTYRLVFIDVYNCFADKLKDLYKDKVEFMLYDEKYYEKKNSGDYDECLDGSRYLL